MTDAKRIADAIGAPQGKCDVTLTDRYANPGCVCSTYADNKGPCRSWEAGVNGRCVYCDHTMACHLEMCQAALRTAEAAGMRRAAEIAAGQLGGYLCPYGRDKPGDPTWNHTDKDLCPVCHSNADDAASKCHDNVQARIAAAILAQTMSEK